MLVLTIPIISFIIYIPMAVKVYTKIHLLKALKEAGLPHTYKSLLNYEKQGVVNRGGEIVSASNDRYFTESEITEIVEKIRRMKQKND